MLSSLLLAALVSSPFHCDVQPGKAGFRALGPAATCRLPKGKPTLWLLWEQTSNQPPVFGKLRDSPFLPDNGAERTQPFADDGSRFQLEATLPLPGREEVLAVFADDGFENHRYAFLTARETPDALVLIGLLTPLLSSSIGTLTVTGVVEGGKDRWLLVGQTAGGDGGETWGTVWIGRLVAGKSFAVVYQERYQNDAGAVMAKRLETQLDREAMQVRVIEIRQPAEGGETRETRKTPIRLQPLLEKEPS